VETVRAYYWLAKPGIIQGNLLTAAAGFLVASGRQLDFGLLVLTLLSIALIIGSACTVNNYIDSDIDRKMKRTNWRATASGQIPLSHVLIYAAILCAAGFIVLAVSTNLITVLVGIVGYIDYVAVYTPSKRRTWHATLLGSICGSMPVVAGYTAVTGQLDAAAFILFLILTFWQMPHFYAIALRRLDDYKAAGIPVLPAVHGARATKSQTLVYMAAFLMAVLALGLWGYAGKFYLIVMGLLALGWLMVGLKGLGASSTKRWAKNVFLYSLVLLPGFFLVIAINVLLTAS
jgi:protoheme IX farnesyltransferase